MAGVMPKIGLYLFLSLICLMLNLSVFFTTLIDSDSEINNFMGETDYSGTDLSHYDEGVSLSGFVFATGGSFIPFVSLISIALIGESLPIEMTVITGLVIGIISAVQVFLLAVIIMNLLPKVLGSGFDV